MTINKLLPAVSAFAGCAVIFALGWAVGGYVERKSSENDKEPEPDTPPEDPKEAERIYHELKTKYAFGDYTEDDDTAEDTEHPYVISPDECGELDYTVHNLVWYADKALCDEQDILIDDAASLVGEEFADHFDEYEPDIVCIRNDKLSSDFEIRRDPSRYIDLVGKRPYLAGDFAGEYDEYDD